MAWNPVARKGTEEMLGEFLREAAVLLLVFGFLEAFFREGETVSVYNVGALGLSVASLVWGIRIERRR
jgi:hypothetical protein